MSDVDPVAPVDPGEPVPAGEPAPARPWTLGELSGGLEKLAADLELLESEVGTAIEDLAKADVTTRDMVKQLAGKLDELLKQKREREIEPRPWDERVGRADWDELVIWVDWLQGAYGFVAGYNLHPCWPAHPGVVEELAGLYHAWRHAQLADEILTKTIAQAEGEPGKRPGSSDLTAWHDRWLWPCLERIKAGHYRIMNCGEKHEPERVLAKLTDRRFIPATAEPVTDRKPE